MEGEDRRQTACMGAFLLLSGRNNPHRFTLLSLNITLALPGETNGSMRDTAHRKQMMRLGHTIGKVAKLKTNSGALGPRSPHPPVTLRY